MSERTPTTPRKGIPLRELRENEERLRGEQSPTLPYSNGGTPVPVERESTSRLANELAQHAAAAGSADPVDMESLIDRLAEKLVEKGGGGGGSGGRRSHPEASAWIRWGFGALLAILGGWWVLGEKFAERPTVQQLKEMRAPDEEAIKRHDLELREQRDSIIEMKGTLRQVSAGITEITAELKSR